MIQVILLAVIVCAIGCWLVDVRDHQRIIRRLRDDRHCCDEDYSRLEGDHHSLKLEHERLLAMWLRQSESHGLLTGRLSRIRQLSQDNGSPDLRVVRGEDDT